MLHKKLMITGCGRSGTRYITFLLKRMKLDVEHEKLGKDGIASWCTAVNTKKLPWGGAIKDIVFDNIFHQVRHPLKVIVSTSSFKEISWQFICSHIPCSMDEPILLRSAKYWYYWNVEAEKIAEWRYRIEDLNNVFDEFCDRLGVPYNLSLLSSVPTDTNTRQYGRFVHFYDELMNHLNFNQTSFLRETLKKIPIERDKGESKLTWESLTSLDPELSEKIREKAHEYGYDT